MTYLFACYNSSALLQLTANSAKFLRLFNKSDTYQLFKNDQQVGAPMLILRETKKFLIGKDNKIVSK